MKSPVVIPFCAEARPIRAIVERRRAAPVLDREITGGGDCSRNFLP
jgi:hypothetical protein